MNEELEVLKTVTHDLHDAGIAYMITGSVAMNYYAFPRMTRDIDIVIEFQENDIAYIDRWVAEMGLQDIYRKAIDD